MLMHSTGGVCLREALRVIPKQRGIESQLSRCNATRYVALASYAPLPLFLCHATKQYRLSSRNVHNAVRISSCVVVVLACLQCSLNGSDYYCSQSDLRMLYHAHILAILPGRCRRWLYPACAEE